MNFQEDLVIHDEYTTKNDNILESFYIPCLQRAKVYKRSTGYFDSKILLLLTKGLGHFAENGGKMKLLMAPTLSEADYQAIKNGYDRIELLDKKIEASFDEMCKFEQSDDRLGLLSYMISTGLLEVKIAIINEGNENAIYHEKLGILEDKCGDVITFYGSGNETVNGFIDNYEAFDVTCSWWGDHDFMRCCSKQDRFDKLWEDREKGVTTIPLPDIIKNKILKYSPKNTKFSYLDKELLEKYKELKKTENINLPSIKSLEDLYDYQQMAIEKWKSQGYRGIFDMATGTGKTFTACGAITRLFEDKKRAFVIICCPYIHLVDQWAEEVKGFNIPAISCYGGLKYEKQVERLIKGYKFKLLNFGCLIVCNATFSGDKFQQLIEKIRNEALLIVDEAHNFGSYKLSSVLHDDYKYRLALSATLERYGDEIGTQKLYDFFGEKAIEYSLREAIAAGKLTEYNYYPVIISLQDDELDKYIELSNKIASVYSGQNSDSDYYKMLLLERARLVAGARNKIDKLMEKIEPYKYDNDLLVYCGAIKYSDEEYSPSKEENKQINIVAEKLRNELDIRAAKFTSQENKEERSLIIDRFKNKFVQALVAIKCLDEGVNIPTIRTAFILASSTNPKEYIQRRGRVLRLASGKEYAEIYDFITLPCDLEKAQTLDPKLLKTCKGLVIRELDRLNDFASLSRNPSSCNLIIQEIKNAFKIGVIEEVNDFE